jgi:O-antigen ligase
MPEPLHKLPSTGRFRSAVLLGFMDRVRAILKSRSCAALILFAASVLLFGEAVAGGPGPAWLRSLALEVRAVCRDPGTQWMGFACCAMYFVTFTLLGNSRTEPADSRKAVEGAAGNAGGVKELNRLHELPGEGSGAGATSRKSAGGAAFSLLANADFWLCGLLLMATLHYAFNYATASSSTQALLLIVGAAIGKGVRLWAEWGGPKHPPSALRHSTSNERELGTGNPKLETLLIVLVLLLAAASLWHPEGAMQFQYRGLNRWSGPWDNPNIFGLLTGVGVVLAAGLLVASGGWQGAGSTTWKRWSWRVLLMLTAGCCSVGLLKSYSRGAWVGTALGLAVLVYQATRFQFSSSSGSWLRRNWMPCSILLAAILVLCFWQFRYTEFHPVRRAFSIGNPNDFSWRNRVAAWEGALAMMADKPVVGFGWNKPERIYDQFYRAPKVSEGMAIQLNHYFILGVSLGLPALICFVMYLGLCLVPVLGGGRGGCSQGRSAERGVRNALASVGLQPSTFNPQPRSVCHAAAVVLLIGLWFDGGLFYLATASVFWALLELGRGTAPPAWRGQDERAPTNKPNRIKP